MKLKKLIGLVAAFAVAASAITATAFAADGDSQEVQGSKTEVNLSVSGPANPGDIVTLQVNFGGEVYIGAVQFQLDWNVEELEYVEGSAHDNPSLGLMTSINAKNLGKIRLASIISGALTQTGTLMEAQFKVLKPNAKIDMTLEEVANGDFDGIDITDQVIANSITQVTVECAHGTLEWVTVSNPTHAENGLRRQVCSACGEVFATEEIPAIGHDDGEWVVTKEASCTEPGARELYCTRCEELLKTEEIPATGHAFGEWTVVKNATCTEAGLEESVCTVCQENQTREIEALGHDDGEWVVTKEASCTEAGIRELHCTRCDELLKTEEIPATGHTFGEWIIDREATEITEGSKHRECAVCGAVETAVIPVIDTEPTEPTKPTDPTESTDPAPVEPDTDPTEQPTKPAESTSGSETGTETDVPETGDSVTALAAGAFAVAAAGALFLLRRKSK